MGCRVLLVRRLYDRGKEVGEEVSEQVPHLRFVRRPKTLSTAASLRTKTLSTVASLRATTAATELR